MKIHILFNFKDGPWGGGNQFLKALREEFIARGVYSKDPKDADCILFNSHHNINEILDIKYKYPNKIIIHRIDGPVFLIRDRDKYIDKTIFKYNEQIADISIFQSEWSKNECTKLGFNSENFQKVIYNGTNPEIFKESKDKGVSERIRLVATSWSDNMRKGFNIYKYLDENLDFSKYSFTFIGNSPIGFKNIQVMPPLDSKDLARKLNESDIYITASQKDPCSNSLIEALNCGLPSVVLNDGGHPELVMCGGEKFNDANDVLEKINKVSNNYRLYKTQIKKRYISNVAEEYFKVINDVHNKKIKGEYTPKKLSVLTVGLLKVRRIMYRLINS